ncbi:MAG TPA: DUF6496 domain-containing protein, partial [Methanosarcina sp.]|nr:DUF6496 domain-containing protein [Methanosarcina sp.]
KTPKSVIKAMRHANVLGAGAKKRRSLSPKNKVTAVMKEYKRGTLHSGSGAIVRNRKQAIAIAISESKRRKRK